MSSQSSLEMGQISLDEFAHQMENQGWVAFPDAVDLILLDALRQDTQKAYQICRQAQIEAGLGENTEGTFHHVLSLGASFTQFLDPLPLIAYLTEYFGGKFILNSFGGVINLKNSKSYVSNIHRDIRIFSGRLPLMINMLIMLDDFTLENGATFLYSGSHKIPHRPLESEFYEKSDRLLGTAGTIVLFNSNLWHSAGQNFTDTPRSALTLNFTKPLIKPQFNYIHSLAALDLSQYSDQFRQILGFNSRIPQSLEEWYQKPEKRTYLPDQDIIESSVFQY
ncbi:MAG: phytanoyl-CoA dioxygenase family protein [Cyanobacteria bacterium]|nr:phytanoyl-CoA dioxygenase family protein [Cyanobacteriota bacterium]